MSNKCFTIRHHVEHSLVISFISALSFTLLCKCSLRAFIFSSLALRAITLRKLRCLSFFIKKRVCETNVQQLQFISEWSSERELLWILSCRYKKVSQQPYDIFYANILKTLCQAMPDLTLRKFAKKRPNNSVKQFTSESGICIGL